MNYILSCLVQANYSMHTERQRERERERERRERGGTQIFLHVKVFGPREIERDLYLYMYVSLSLYLLAQKPKILDTDFLSTS